MRVNTDIELIERTLEGETAAFGQLVRRYQDRLFTSVMHVVGQREEAEDIVQDTFVQALQKLSTFRRKSTFYTWIYRIAFNAAANRQRRARPEVPLTARSNGSGPEPTDPHDSPNEQLLRAERVRQIKAAINGLAEEFRSVLVLREIDEFDYETIADVLGITVGTVRSRLHRARTRMREQLRGMQYGSPTT